MRRLVRLLGIAAVASLARVAVAGAEPQYVGDTVCFACHEDASKQFAHTVHGKLFTPSGQLEAMRHGCEGCHGPGSAHVEAGGGKGVGGMIQFGSRDPSEIQRENAVCLQCHSMGERIHWDGSTHQLRDVSCASCHDVMKLESLHNLLSGPNELATCGQCHLIQKAQTQRYGHMPVRDGTIPDRDAKMSCTSCHNPHGTVAEALLRQNTINDTCYTCHADKRGPFLWNHPPVLENCLNCHDPHGSPREFMLRLSPPRLCQTCHDPTRHPTDPRLPTSQFVIGSGCMQCHVNIHGSNHPSGMAFTR